MEAKTSQLLSNFRASCDLFDSDHEIISELSSFTERPIPKRFQQQSLQASSGDLSVGLVLEEDIENIQQFYNWMDSLEGQSDSPVDETYSLYQQRLLLYNDLSVDILSELDKSLESLDTLENQYLLVSTKTGELHQDCENLLQQQQNLVKFAEQVEERLAYFNEVEEIQKLFSRPNLSVLDPNFIDALRRLDKSISFISENPSFRESRIYMMKFQQLQTRGLTMVKAYIVASLRNTSKHTTEDFETRAYIKFRSLANNLSPLCKEIESRAQRREYQSLLSDCHYCYFQQRNRILYSKVENDIKGFSKLDDLAAMIRSGCAYLIKLCQSEYELYKQFFSSFSTAMRNLLEGFGDMLYNSLRPLFIRAQEVDLLCSSAHILKSEILFTIQEKGESVQAFLGVINRMLEDIQERLIFLAQRFILEQICTFSPQPEDLDYPSKLFTDDNQNIYAYWYPTLEKTLMFLSRLYLSIDAKIFEGLAQETVSECCHSLKYASKIISQKQNSWMDGQLFLIQHLMILREQITPFDINFCITEKALDFSLMKDAFSNLFRGSFSWKNSLNASPRVIESQVDSRKALEKTLSDNIEDFCRHVAGDIIEPLSSFLITAASFTRSQKTPLREQQFANITKVKEILYKTVESFKKLESSISKLCLYFKNSTNLSYMYDRLRDYILADFKSLFHLLDTSYLPEERITITETLETVRSMLEFENWKISSKIEEDKKEEINTTTTNVTNPSTNNKKEEKESVQSQN